jgi:hypothetical protein
LESRHRSKLWPFVVLAAGAVLYRTRRKKPSSFSWAHAGAGMDRQPLASGAAVVDKPAAANGLTASGGADVFVETLTDLSDQETTSTDQGWIEIAEGQSCPPGYPIKGNANSHIYHMPGQASYERTIPEICFATEEAAAEMGYRPPKR